MIVDTSAIIAIAYREIGWKNLLSSLRREGGFIPAPVVVELYRVTSDGQNAADPDVVELVDLLLHNRVTIVPFDSLDMEQAIAANSVYGSGNGRGGLLNMLDLMVYGAAKARDLSILCTGFDYFSTDANIHPASRRG